MTIKITPLDTASLVPTLDDQLELIRDAMSTNDPSYIVHAIGVVARARGLTAVEQQTGIKRQSLNKALRSGANPTLKTLLPVLEALNLRLTIAPEPKAA